jgi:hypothetical protein
MTPFTQADSKAYRGLRSVSNFSTVSPSAYMGAELQPCLDLSLKQIYPPCLGSDWTSCSGVGEIDSL